MDKTKVILVDQSDNPVGETDKMEAHRKGLLHRAVSVFIVNSAGEWLLHRRSLGKYHSGGLWTNTTCTHPHPGESVEDAAKRRLREEMGMDTQLTRLFSFIYNEPLNNGLTEHELDHVFWGVSDEIPSVNPGEVMDWKYTGFEALLDDIQSSPQDYTVWFTRICSRVRDDSLKLIKSRI